jgi:osmotically-inducible protein OsmY
MLSGCIAAVSTGIVSLGVTAAKDKTTGQSIDDSALSLKIKKEFIKRGFKNLYTKINVEVNQGRVLYTGYVINQEDTVAAIEIAWAQKEVKEVVNELIIDENNTGFDSAQYAKDSWITTKLKSKLFLERKIKFVNYTVVTTKGVIYLFGVARTEEELRKVSEIAATIGGVEKVISHVIIKDIQNVANPDTQSP